MVTVKLMGGLGNQMFQYAIGRSIAYNNNEELKLDISFYSNIDKNTTPRKYKLDHFKIVGKVISVNSIFKYKLFIQYNITRHFSFIPLRYKLENKLTYNSNILKNKNKDIYLNGYWQCEKYFLNCKELIKSDFKIITPQNEKNKKWTDLINKKTSVCLHVRRGDYVTNPDAQKIHGVLQGKDGLEYYKHAIEYISEHVKNPVFFVFSDDMEWVKENINTGYETYYMNQNKPEEDYEDLRLMTQCKHFIIANSSFSWWGAWLSSYADKIVICPNRWFADPNMKTDIICDEWIRL